ncbi:mitogen-activated protein kinase kinase kinase 2-like [Hydractinia symbiolongicarpus]|uniref:mitogen-activated protein kinase kinase kinase 2-like n=1 Tax=Hydractinia symbiolongicarpus TaxID=13093 RepID=UPI00254F73E6|nr:mitogen-activated protein kinase kinase kinase 2-like [Hydractinia symbiolongicarpus]
MSLNRSLLDAVKENDLDLVKELLQHSVEVNCTDECGYTPLHWAAIYGKPEITHALLNDSNCDINLKDRDHYTALHLCTKHGHNHVLQLLINYGANIDLKTKGGRVAEDLALARGAMDTVQIFQNARKKKQNSNRNKPKVWELGKLLGCGAFGQVYLGIDTETGKEVAIKCIKTNGQRLTVIKKQVQELDNEIGVLRNLSHKNILQYYGFEKVKPSSMYIFMEYMPGGNMHDLVQRVGGLGEEQLRKYTQQIIEGVSYLHVNMVIHRDIKGANILLDLNHVNVKLADFGLSKKIERCSMMSDLQSVLGSPYWMAPEVIKATPTNIGYGRKADIWSIGCTMIEMLTTKPPFSNMEPMSAMYNIGSGRKSPEIPSGLSDSLGDFFYQCFKRDPRCRPSAQDLLNHPYLKKDRFPSVQQESEANCQQQRAKKTSLLSRINCQLKTILSNLNKLLRSVIGKSTDLQNES